MGIEDIFDPNEYEVTRTQQASREHDPWVTEGAKDIYGRATTEAAKPYTAFEGQRVAPLAENLRIASDAAKFFRGKEFREQYFDPARTLLSENKYTAAPVEVGDVATGRLDEYDLSGYINPYTKAAIDPVVRDIREEAARKEQALRHGKEMRTAFGGSRQAVAEELLRRGTERQAADVQAKGYKTAFDTAAGLYETDEERLLKAALANQAKDVALGKFGEQSRQEQAKIATAQAGQYGNLATQFENVKTSIVDRLMKTGKVNQEHAQLIADRAYEDYLDKRGWDKDQIMFESEILKGLPKDFRPKETTETEYGASDAEKVLGGIKGVVDILEDFGVSTAVKLGVQELAKKVGIGAALEASGLGNVAQILGIGTAATGAAAGLGTTAAAEAILAGGTAAAGTLPSAGIGAGLEAMTGAVSGGGAAAGGGAVATEGGILAGIGEGISSGFSALTEGLSGLFGGGGSTAASSSALSSMAGFMTPAAIVALPFIMKGLTARGPVASEASTVGNISDGKVNFGEVKAKRLNADFEPLKSEVQNLITSLNEKGVDVSGSKLNVGLNASEKAGQGQDMHKKMENNLLANYPPNVQSILRKNIDRYQNTKLHDSLVEKYGAGTIVGTAGAIGGLAFDGAKTPAQYDYGNFGDKWMKVGLPISGFYDVTPKGEGESTRIWFANMTKPEMMEALDVTSPELQAIGFDPSLLNFDAFNTREQALGMASGLLTRQDPNYEQKLASGSTGGGGLGTVPDGSNATNVTGIFQQQPGGDTGFDPSVAYNQQQIAGI